METENDGSKSGESGDPPENQAGPEGNQDPPQELTPVEKVNEAIGRLDAKTKELKEIESSIDKKSTALKKLIQEAAIEGRALAGNPRKSKDEEAKEAAMSLVEGTGLNPFA